MKKLVKENHTPSNALDACEYAENSSNENAAKPYRRPTHRSLMWQVGNVLIEAGSLIQAGSPIQVGGSEAFVLIEAGGLY